jgi:hypothetical protein
MTSGFDDGKINAHKDERHHGKKRNDSVEEIQAEGMKESVYC